MVDATIEGERMKDFNERHRPGRGSAGRSGRSSRRAYDDTVFAMPEGSAESQGDLCWGRNPVISFLENFPSRCAKVLLSKTMQRAVFERITGLCRASAIPFLLTEPRAMDEMLKGQNHQGVVAVVLPCELLKIEEVLEALPVPPNPALVVLPDHIQDPRNLGAMIRSAEAAGASCVAIPLRRSSLPTGTVLKTSAGASSRLPIAAVGNVANAVRVFQTAGFWAVGLDAGAERSIFSEPLPSRILLVVGGESKGLASTTQKACDETVRIPIRGGVGSLNAAVALSIAMFEWTRNHLLCEN